MIDTHTVPATTSTKSPVSDDHGVTMIPMPFSIFNPPDYRKMRFRCEVDYAVVCVTLNRPSNFNTVRRRTDATYVHALDKGPGGAATQFEIRFDDPRTRSDMLRRLSALQEHADGFSIEPRLNCIEVALDGFSHDSDSSAVLAMTERFFRFGTTVCSNNTRMTRAIGEVVWAQNPMQVTEKLRQGFTIVIGDTGAPVTQRIYCKTTDKNGRVHLPSEQHRARREVTLTGEGLDDWKKVFQSRDLRDSSPWKFEALAPWFRFRKLRHDLELSALRAMMINNQVLLGVRQPGNDGRRLYKRFTQADTQLNELARDQLRELSRRFSSLRS